MESLQEYSHKDRAKIFIGQLERRCSRVVKGDAEAMAAFVELFNEPSQDTPPYFDGVGKIAERFFSESELTAVMTGKQIMERFGRNFGWDSTAWEIGLTPETPELKRFIESTAELILNILDPKNSDFVKHNLINAHTSFAELVAWTDMQATKTPSPVEP